MSEYIIPLKKLTMFLNSFYLNGSLSFEVHSPHLQCRLFSIKLDENTTNAKVSHILNRELYSVAYEEGTKGIETLMQEIPDFIYYRFILLSSGVCLPKNWEKLSEEISKMLDRDPLKGQRSVFLSFDTNALMTRYYHLISKMIKNKRELSRCGYVISNGVIDELNKFDIKYSGSDLSNLGRNLKNNNAWDGFMNQQKLLSRKFKMGISEFKVLTINEYFEKVQGETGDNAIISSLEQFSKNKNVDVIVISEDSDFIEKATANQRLIGVRLDVPDDLPESIIVRWEDIIELLYSASVIYGNLMIKGAVNARISGIWMGKKGESWNDEAILIRTENKKVIEFLDKSIQIMN